MRTKLITALKPVYIDIINESHMHNVPKGSESHFKIIVVSPLFNNETLIKRHRLVNTLLAEELQHSIHALSIIARTEDQWEADNSVSKSPACLGGDGSKI